MGSEISESQVQDIFRQVGVNYDRNIDFTQFCKVIKKFKVDKETKNLIIKDEEPRSSTKTVNQSDFSLTSDSDDEDNSMRRSSHNRHLKIERISNLVNFDPEPKQMCSIAIGTEPVRYSIGIEATSENNLNVMVCAESIEE